MVNFFFRLDVHCVARSVPREKEGFQEIFSGMKLLSRFASILPLVLRIMSNEIYSKESSYEMMIKKREHGTDLVNLCFGSKIKQLR